MKQRLLTLLCLLCCLSASTAWADTYSHEIAKKTWSAYDKQTLSNVDWTASATGGDYWGYDSSRGQQFGSSKSPASSLTLSTSDFTDKILSVKVSTSGASSVEASLSVTVGGTKFKCNNLESVSITATNTEYNFTGDATGEIVINWGQTSSKALYLKKIEVVYGSEQPKSAPAFTTQPIGTEYDKDAVATPLSVEVSGYPAPTLQWYSNSAASAEDATAIEGATGKTYTPATATVGTTYYYCVATNSEGSASSNIVSVVVKEVTLDGKGEGTAESPFDVTRALAYINKGLDSTVDLYVKGIISEVKDVYLNYGNATYLISVDGETTSSQLTIYRGNYLNNAAFTSADQIQASDNVVIVGKLIKYDKTSEMAQGNYIVSHMRDGKITPTLTFAPEEVTAYLDALDEFKAPILATDPEGLKVAYSLTGDAVGTIDVDGTLHLNAAGTATVTASADDESYGDATATYTLKVVANKPNFVMLVAKAQNGKYYAMSNETGDVSNSLKAIEINVDNYEAMKGDSNLLWVINVNNNKATIFNAGNSQYLVKGSGNTDLKTQSGTYDWTWDDSHQYGSMETGTTTTTKRSYLGIVDKQGRIYFKNYAVGNVGNNDGTGSYFTTYTMPDFINKLRKVDVETLDKDHINVYVESGTTNVSNEVQLLDGISINVEDNVSVEKLVYNRTFTATQANTWQPFFVPFTINTAELPEGAIVAEMDKVSYATDDDDNVTYTLVWKPSTGELAANKPYIIHLGSEEAVANFDFVSKNAELQTTDCTEQAVLSFTTEDNAKFEFWGTYEPITNMKTAFGGNSYVLSSGQFVHPKDNVVLKPFRYYLLFKPNASGKSNMIIKNVINDETEGIEEIMIEDTSDNVYIDLMGRRIENPTTGIYIHNGKKVFVK